MGSNTSKFSLEKAIGNVLLPRVANPTLRGSVRRSDPDGGHASPFFVGLTGKTLIVTVTPVGDLTINFASDLISDAVTAINTASPANLKAADEDGYIRITNLNSGNKNSLTVKGGTSTTILGFMVGPEPGSISFAGEIASSPPGRSQTNVQNNPQGTHLIAQDEDLSSSAINRGIVGSLEHVERIARDLDREIPIIRKITVTTATLPTTAERIFVVADPTIRFPVDGFGIAVSNPSGLLIDQLVRIKSSPDDTDVYDIAQTDPVPHISKVLYNTGSIGVSDITQTFAVWGTPDGKSVFNSQLRNKQPPVTISKVRGNVIEAATAAFVTNVSQPGDTLIIEAATNNNPFNHNGEFVITEVIDETRVAVRAKGSAEKTYITTDIPTELNASLPGGTTYGTVRVIVGSYIPGTALTFVVPSWIPNATTFFVHLYCGVRIRDLRPGDVGVRFSANDEAVLSILRTHITTAAGFRHHSIDVDAAAIASSPHSLGVGTVSSQITALLALINSPIAAETAYAGGPAWRDGVTNPATTVEAQLDKIISDLTGAAGAIKIGYAGGPNWADGSTNPATGVENQLDKIVSDLAGSGGAIKIGYAGSGNWADGTTNPATSIEAQLDKIVSDLTGAAGTGKIQGSVVGSDLAAGTLSAQLADLAANWLKMSRNNTIAGVQTFSALVTANLGLTVNGSFLTSNTAIQANLGMDVGTNQSIFLHGTGDLKHGLKTIVIGPDRFAQNSAATGQSTVFTGGGWFVWLAPTTSIDIVATIPLKSGDRISSYSALIVSTGNGGVPVTLDLATQSVTAPFTVQDTFTGTGPAPVGHSLVTRSVTFTLSSTDCVLIRIRCAGDNGVAALIVNYDRP